MATATSLRLLLHQRSRNPEPLEFRPARSTPTPLSQEITIKSLWADDQFPRLPASSVPITPQSRGYGYNWVSDFARSLFRGESHAVGRFNRLRNC